MCVLKLRIMAQNIIELRKKCMTQTKKDLKVALALPDRRISQAISAIDEMEDALCTISDRLREWYLLYYPEAVSRIKKQDAFTRIVAEKKTREEFTDIPKDSIGGEFSNEDLHTMRSYAKTIALVYSEKGQIELYLAKLMKKYFPNLNAIADTKVGAQLIAHCGDAKRLAKLPSSTIQVLGAEKALFRHMKTGAKPPKYGIIFGHNLVQNARVENRGKTARALASIISMAVKVDVYGTEDKSKALATKLENKIRRIQK